MINIFSFRRDCLEHFSSGDSDVLLFFWFVLKKKNNFIVSISSLNVIGDTHRPNEENCDCYSM